MPFVEYKLHRDTQNQMGKTPEFISSGGYDFNESDYTYVGYIAKESDNFFHVPNTIVYLDSASYIERRSNLKYSNDGEYLLLDSDGSILGYDSNGYPLKMSDDSCRTEASDQWDELIRYHEDIENKGIIF
tara:strand:- start:27078 stop:27467 length:390 start_codon:yes stop_codon:yes gene_type:complete